MCQGRRRAFLLVPLPEPRHGDPPAKPWVPGDQRPGLCTSRKGWGSVSTGRRCRHLSGAPFIRQPQGRLYRLAAAA